MILSMIKHDRCLTAFCYNKHFVIFATACDINVKDSQRMINFTKWDNLTQTLLQYNFGKTIVSAITYCRYVFINNFLRECSLQV